MKLSTLRLGAVTLGALAVTTVGSVAPALAVPAPNGVSNVLALAGSDTIQDVDNVLVNRYNSNTAKNPNPADKAVNVPAFFSGSVTVPGDAYCESRTYSMTPAAGEFVAPNGSGAGKSALATSAANGDGCIDIARSSSGPSSTDPSTFEYYAFARDAVSFGAFKPGPAPVKLTLDQLRGIYDCTFTNYNQVGGGNAPILRYVPQAGSGTGKFFNANVLGFDPATYSTPSCPAVRTFQENTGSSVPAGDRRSAILPYSAAQYVAQGNGVVTDVRDGLVEGAIDGKNPVLRNKTTGVYSPSKAVYTSTTFPGARDVFHVVDTRSPSYGDALRFIGFDSSGPGAVCSGAFNSTLTQYGFVPNAKLDTQGICRYSSPV